MATQKQFVEVERAAIYCRLSKEDRFKSEDEDSRSIQTQKIMLQNYVNEHGWQTFDIYFDDDFSGSDADRPEFNRMINDAQQGLFDIVVCKDQSRFARDIIVCEKYINRLFPVWGIRFIGVSDGADTAETNNKKSRQIKSLVDEWYLEDTSDRIKSALHTRMKQGLFIGSFAPYGYKRHPDNTNQLIVDEPAAEIVREIFYLFTIEGIGKTAIARQLNNEGHPNPSSYKEQNGIKKNMSNKCKSHLWRYSSVDNVLRNEAYIGNMVQHKYHNPTYHCKHSVPCNKEDFIRVCNTHDAIIDMDLWRKTQKVLSERVKPFSTVCQGDLSKHPTNVFSHKLFCKYCGYHLTTAINVRDGKKTRYHRCSTKMFDKNTCVQGVTVSDVTMTKYVLEQIRGMIREYSDVDEIEQKTSFSNTCESKIKKLNSQIVTLKEKQEKSGGIFQELYTDKLNGVITQEQFVMLVGKFDKDNKDTSANILALEREIEELKEKMSNGASKRSIIMEYLDCKTLSKSMVDTLIEQIIVGGTRNHREIEIVWKF